MTLGVHLGSSPLDIVFDRNSATMEYHVLIGSLRAHTILALVTAPDIIRKLQLIVSTQLAPRVTQLIPGCLAHAIAAFLSLGGEIVPRLEPGPLFGRNVIGVLAADFVPE